MVNWSDPTCRKATNKLTFLGTKGKIVADKQELRLFLQHDNGANGFQKGWNVRYQTDLLKPVRFYLRGEDYTGQLDHFVACVQSGKTGEISNFATALQTDLAMETIRSDERARN